MRAPYLPALLLALFVVPLSVSADTTPPTLVSVTLQSNNTNTAYARVGDSITVNLTADEDLSTTTITILGQAVTARTFSDPKFYFGSHIVGETDVEGDITFTIEYTDAAGNVGTPVSASTNSSFVRIDRTAPVVDAMPDITLEGNVAGGAQVSFTAPAASDTDAGALTSTCAPASGTLFSVGTTTVTCRATDHAGNQGSATFAVVVADTVAPTLTLTGSASMSVERGEAFTDPGATAVDIVDDTNVTITVTGTVDTATDGDYVLTYTAEDQSGNIAQATRTVSVDRSSGGGGGGGSSSRRQQTSEGALPAGEVLGATAYHFSRTLSTGASGNDVLELQKVLQSLGFFSETPTGYYGPVTESAVARYQASKGLEQVGIVGPRTLAALNGETTIGSTDTAAKLAVLYAELERLMAELKKLKGEA